MRELGNTYTAAERRGMAARKRSTTTGGRTVHRHANKLAALMLDIAAGIRALDTEERETLTELLRLDEQEHAQAHTLIRAALEQRVITTEEAQLAHDTLGAAYDHGSPTGYAQDAPLASAVGVSMCLLVIGQTAPRSVREAMLVAIPGTFTRPADAEQTSAP